jgi:hypothetical protein
MLFLEIDFEAFSESDSFPLPSVQRSVFGFGGFSESGSTLLPRFAEFGFDSSSKSGSTRFHALRGSISIVRLPRWAVS